MRLVFDRGTILFADLPPGFDPSRLRGVVWDPRVGRHRAPARLRGDIREWLTRQGVPFLDEVPSRPDDLGAWSAVPLRPYQDAALLSWTLGAARGVVVLPTGSGKTRLAIAAMARANRPAICLVPTRVLLHQWRAEIAKFYGGPVGCLGDGEHETRPLTVSTFESAYRRMAEIGNRFDLLVVDEVHHFGGGVRDEALEMCTAPSRLGLTATPPAPDAVTRLEGLVGPVVYQLAVGDLAGRWLASFDVVVLELRLDPEERRNYDDWMKSFTEMSIAQRCLNPWGTFADLVRAASKTEQGRRAVAGFRKARRLLGFTRAKAAAVRLLLSRHRDSRVLVFTADNETAYAIAREHLVMPITCDIGRKEREVALDRFRRGELRTLVSARVLNEGIDVPDADVAIVVGAALAEREHVQRVGRLLRPAEGKRAIIYELVTTDTSEVDKAHRRRKALGNGPSPLSH